MKNILSSLKNFITSAKIVDAILQVLIVVSAIYLLKSIILPIYFWNAVVYLMVAAVILSIIVIRKKKHNLAVALNPMALLQLFIVMGVIMTISDWITGKAFLDIILNLIIAGIGFGVFVLVVSIHESKGRHIAQ